MKKKYRLKPWVKVVITIALIIAGYVIYDMISINGALANESTLASIFICLGWFWLVVGQIMMLYLMWEN